MQQSDDPQRRGMALTCYCDDSGSHEQAKVAVVGGLVLTKDRFTELCGRWKAILKEFKLEKIHMREWSKVAMAPEMRKALFLSIAKAINECKIYSVSASIPQDSFNALLPQEVRRKFMGPYALAFLLVIIVNKMAGALTPYDYRVAYLIGNSSDNHREQLQGAHAIALRLEQREQESFTGAMASDRDDRNYALQAADVIAWTYHRKLESQNFGQEFEPLLPIVEYQLKISPTKTKLHLSLDVPLSGVEYFAFLVNRWLTNQGPLPSWQEIMDSRIAYENDKRV
jgi:hypothetical protein